MIFCHLHKISDRLNQNGDNINDIFAKHLYSFGNFKFNRDEANNYGVPFL